MLKPSKRFT
jgi:integration host factor subunit beta